MIVSLKYLVLLGQAAQRAPLLPAILLRFQPEVIGCLIHLGLMLSISQIVPPTQRLLVSCGRHQCPGCQILRRIWDAHLTSVEVGCVQEAHACGLEGVLRFGWHPGLAMTVSSGVWGTYFLVILSRDVWIVRVDLSIGVLRRAHQPACRIPLRRPAHNLLPRLLLPW
jgi:hypothetical protein